MKILISSGFLETEQPSFRENQYSRLLAQEGNSVTIHTSNASSIWRFNRAGVAPTMPGKYDTELLARGVSIVRRRPLFRYADFLILPPPFRLIKEADLVHVIEFRQGNSVLVAAIAKLLGKPVIYDHEQRGDRHYSILHSADSIFRRTLIGIGSCFVNAVRHTVLANKDHFLRNRWRSHAPLYFSPLGADERFFFFSATERERIRSKYGISPDTRVAVVTGKLDSTKHSLEAIRACIANGLQVIVAGTLSSDIKDAVATAEGVTYIGKLTATELNSLYCAADTAIFTTFSISYWEALATGLRVFVPRTKFSELIADPDLFLFGSEDMFEVVEEQYKRDYNVQRSLQLAIQNSLNIQPTGRLTKNHYLWTAKIGELTVLYKEQLGGR